MSYSWLPQTLDEIAQIAGVEAALSLADARGGSRISIPSRVKTDHWLIKTVGKEAADKICEFYRTGYNGTKGAVIDLPTGPSSSASKTRRKVDAMIRDGVSADKIAVSAGVHRNTVFRRKRKMKLPEYNPQPDLFD